MPLKALVDDYVSAEMKDCFVVDDSAIHEPSEFDLVFLASLYNGNSQLAFRELYAAMLDAEAVRSRILLLDRDKAYPRHFDGVTSPQRLAAGCVLSAREGGTREIGCGDELEQLRTSLKEFFEN